MKKLLIIGALLGAAVINSNAQSAPELQAEVNLSKARLSAFFFTGHQVGGMGGYAPQQQFTLNTNATPYVPAVVNVLSGGQVTVSSNASPFVLANTLGSAINVASSPAFGATNSLAALNAALTVVGKPTVEMQ